MTTTTCHDPNPIQSHLNSKDYKATHPAHGLIEIHREHKKPGADIIFFSLRSVSSHTDYRLKARIIISNSDHHYASTFGYDTIELPHALQNRGVSYFVNKVLADTARVMGIDRFIIDAVVSSVLDHACNVMGMTHEKTFGGYAASPHALISRCETALVRKGWRDQSGREPAVCQ